MADYDRKDALYQKAKKEGYASRAAYKLIELQKKYNLIKPNMKVFDLGSWPGGWLQVAAPLIKDRGCLVGIDLVALDQEAPFVKQLNALPNFKFIQGDAQDQENIDQAKSFAGAEFDLVISDMSPKLKGIKEADNAAIINSAELAFDVASKVLRKGGNLVLKVFKSHEIDRFVKDKKASFNKFSRAELESTRTTSNEYYLIGFGLK